MDRYHTDYHLILLKGPLLQIWDGCVSYGARMPVFRVLICSNLGFTLYHIKITERSNRQNNLNILDALLVMKDSCILARYL
jgi:hypothetical protein